MPVAADSIFAMVSPEAYRLVLQAIGAVGSLTQISFIVISIFGLWYRLSGRFAAHRARKAHMNTMRRESLAGVDAWVPGEKAFGISPLVLMRPPGRRGHRDRLRWPRHSGGV